MKRRRRNKGGGGAPKWMVTYSDMVTLILVFFILLFSMSQIDQQRFDALVESFQDRAIFDFLPSAVPMDHPSNGDWEDSNAEGQERDTGGDRNDDENEIGPAENPMEEKEENEYDEPRLEERLEKLLVDIEAYLDDNELEDLVTASRTEYGVSLVLQEKILFDTGEAMLIDAGEDLLDDLASLLSDIPNNVRVEGHTDSRPMTSYRYPSNWELSGARASSVVRYFIEEHELGGERFSAVGYGETRPIVENTPETWHENRRVEIVILDSKIENGETE